MQNSRHYFQDEINQNAPNCYSQPIDLLEFRNSESEWLNLKCHLVKAISLEAISLERWPPNGLNRNASDTVRWIERDLFENQVNNLKVWNFVTHQITRKCRRRPIEQQSICFFSKFISHKRVTEGGLIGQAYTILKFGCSDRVIFKLRLVDHKERSTQNKDRKT